MEVKQEKQEKAVNKETKNEKTTTTKTIKEETSTAEINRERYSKTNSSKERITNFQKPINKSTRAFDANKKTINGSRNRNFTSPQSRRLRNGNPRLRNGNPRLRNENPEYLKQKRDRERKNREIMTRVLKKIGEVKDENIKVENSIDENKEKTDFDTYKEVKKEEEARLLSKIMELKDYVEVSGSEIVDGSYTRVVIIGDYFLLNLSKLWPAKSNIKPYFLYKNKLSIDELMKFQNHDFLQKSKKILVLFMLGLHDFIEYGIYMKASCTGNHLFTEYIKDLKPHDIWAILRQINEIKETFEKDESLSVVFSYFPELQNIRDLQLIFNTSKEDIPNCTCLCNKLGELPGENVELEFNELNKIHNQRAMTKQINTLREKDVFEYICPTISFVNGIWTLAKEAENIEEDASVLNCLLNEFVFDVDYVDVLDQTRTDLIKKQVAAMRSLITKNKCRIVLIGDNWINNVASQWKSQQSVRPFFYIADNLTLDDMQKAILSLVKGNELALVITAIPSGEMFSMRESSKCSDHEPLTFPILNDAFLANPVGFAYNLIDKMNSFLKEIKILRKHCGVAFTTCYPAQFTVYYDHLLKLHDSEVGQDKHAGEADSPLDIDFSMYETELSKCTDIINQYIRTANEVQKVPVCDVAQDVTSDECFPFPMYIDTSIPSKLCGKELFACVKKYIQSMYDMVVSGKLSFTRSELSEELLRKQSKRLYFRELGRANRGDVRVSNNPRGIKRFGFGFEDFSGNKRVKLNVAPEENSSLLVQESASAVPPPRMLKGIPHLNRSFTTNGPARAFLTTSGIPNLAPSEDRPPPPVNYIRSLASMGERPVARAPLRDPDEMSFDNQGDFVNMQGRSPPRALLGNNPLRNFRETLLIPRLREAENSLRMERMEREREREREELMMARSNNLNTIRVIGERPMMQRVIPNNPVRIIRDLPMNPGPPPNRNW